MMRVLIVDDDQPIRSLLTELFVDEGYEALQASDGQAAIQIAQAARPDVVLMDINMPVLDGITAMRQLKDDPTTRKIPIIAMSAGRTLRLHAEYLPADGILAKPFDLETAVAAVALAIAQASGGV